MPNRIIKESICRSDSIDSLSWFEEVLFYRLIVVCDDYGRFDGRAAVVKGSCFPLKDDITKKQIAEALERLSIAGLVRGYEVRGKSFLQLTAWEKHQQIRAKNSKYPAPETVCNHMISDDSNSPRESKYENRESYSRIENARARDTDTVRLFTDFVSAYPKPCTGNLTEYEYVSLLASGNATEEELVQCARNYADECRIKGKPEDYIYNAENFLKKLVFKRYLPGNYKKPKPQRKLGTGFSNFEQRDYDFDKLERQLLESQNKESEEIMT